MSKKIRKQEGITLVALVITIIILLILAGISIQALTGTGLFEKTNQAKERTIKAQLKEEIEMAIQEIQMEEIPEGRTVDLKLLYDEKKLEGKLENIIMEWSEDGITGEYKDYEYVIDDKLNVTIEGKVGVKPEITYELSSTEPQQEEITITVKATISEGEVKSIVNPDNEEIIGNEITYKVTKNGKYTFIAKSSTGTREKKTIDITNIKITAPIISVIQTGGYPLMKSSGIVGTLSKVQIAYEDNPNLVNYYSEDNGTTWNEYKGTIETGKSKIMAKSVDKENEQIASDITTQTIDAPDDAIGIEAYDNNEETYFSSTKKSYMMVDDDMIGKMIYITVKCDYPGTVNLLNENNKVIYSKSLKTGIHEICIKNGTKKLTYTSFYSWDKLVEIKIENDKVTEYNGNILYVATNGDDTTGNGSQENPYATIGKAVEQASDEDKIFVKEGTYNVALKYIDRYSSYAIYDNNKKICIYGENEKTVLICDGTNVSTRDSALFCLKNQNSTVRNLTTIYYPHRNII